MDSKLPKYNDIEASFRSDIIVSMENAKEQRSQSHVEFDDMDYVTYWTTNAKAANAYIPPKVDEQDVRTTSGTTLEKKNVLLTSILNLNLEPDIEAYDKSDNHIEELGTLMEDLIKKSRKIENYDEKRIDIYNEFLSQGTVFLEDRYLEFQIPGKDVESFGLDDVWGIKWKKKIDKIYKECSSILITGLNVYLGNIREPDIQKQPFIVLRRLISASEAKSIYGKWKRFENVPTKLEKLNSNEKVDNVEYNNWTLESFKKNMVEEVRYMNRWTNDFMILLNGVMMFPVRTDGTYPLSGINNTNLYPIAMGRIEPITNFAYGKSIPSKTKVDQALFDEMLKALVVKTRKSYYPPMANNTGQTLSKRVLWAGNIEDDINPEKLTQIGTNLGVSGPEFNSLGFIKQIIDEKSVAPIMEGMANKERQTAREIIELKQQSMMKMGLAIAGVISLEKQLCKLRLYNILKNWTEPVSKGIEGVKGDLFRTITVDTDFEDGEKGQRIINFTEELPQDDQVFAEEQILKKLKGKNIRKNYINPKMLQNIEYNWNLEITPTPKDTNSLRQAQFEESVQKALAIFAPLGKLPNLDYLASRWATNAGENPDKFWAKAQQQMPQPGQPQGQPQAPNMPGGQPKVPMPDGKLAAQLTGGSAMPGPTVNTMSGA